MNSTEENIKRFETLLGSVNRIGIDNVIAFARTSDFYTAPASSRFHLACPGGLLQHSLNVYDCLVAKQKAPFWQGVIGGTSDDTIKIVALLHDLCKVGFYSKTLKNRKTYDAEKISKADRWKVKDDHDGHGPYIWESYEAYTVEETNPLGHGEKSVIMLLGQLGVQLTEEEIYAIRWHMGFSVPTEEYSSLGLAMEKYPLVLALHEADLEASKILEVND